MSLNNFYLIAGPCVIESEEHCLKMAKSLIDITQKLNIPFIFKASFDKANRTSITSYRGVGIDEGLRILQLIKDTYNVPILTDIHSVEQVDKVVSVADVIQIPAFLCRQTDLLVACGKAVAGTGKAINVKKGQFCNHITMQHAYKKIDDAIQEQNKESITNNYFWNKQIWLCDRGNMNGYDDLVVDMRGLVQMRESGNVNIVQDATHALQQPNRAGKTLGQRYLIPTIARGAVATGIDGLFMEVHDKPHEALSDATTQWPLHYLEPLLKELLEIHHVTQGRNTYYVDKDY